MICSIAINAQIKGRINVRNDICENCGFIHSRDVTQMYDGISQCMITLQGRIGEAQAQLRWQMRENERLIQEVRELKAKVGA